MMPLFSLMLSVKNIILFTYTNTYWKINTKQLPADHTSRPFERGFFVLFCRIAFKVVLCCHYKRETFHWLLRRRSNNERNGNDNHNINCTVQNLVKRIYILSARILSTKANIQRKAYKHPVVKEMDKKEKKWFFFFKWI